MRQMKEDIQALEQAIKVEERKEEMAATRRRDRVICPAMEPSCKTSVIISSIKLAQSDSRVIGVIRFGLSVNFMKHRVSPGAARFDELCRHMGCHSLSSSPAFPRHPGPRRTSWLR